MITVDILKNDLASLDVGHERTQRIFDDELHPDRGSEMKHPIGALDKLVHEKFIQDIADDNVETGIFFKVGDIFKPAGREVIEKSHLVTLFEQGFGEMTSDETGSSGDEDFHGGEIIPIN